MSDDGFGPLMSALDPPLAVVTAAAAGERAGCLVSFHTQSSIAPQRYCVFLSKANHTYGVALRASHLAIHFLAVEDLPLAELFGGQTGDTVDKFAGLQVSEGPGGAPLLAQCPRWLAARRVAVLDEGGDHVAVTTEPVAALASGPFIPLRVAQAGHIRPGHDASERHDPDA
jgi:flavin reductase (DIM6/NTAB) family NADH-FMN oxidoreductase RutF